MTNKTIEVLRDLIDTILSGPPGEAYIDAKKELRALLAASEAPRQEPVEAMPPMTDRRPYDDEDPEGYLEGDDDWSSNNPGAVTWLADNHTAIRLALYTSPPAPVSVLPSRDAMRDLIAETIGGDTYDCTRVWSAWGVGTMSEDDFVSFVDQDERLYELADAFLDKAKELNT